jgi:glycosyltransferase involved in cell wall biosynthesis
MYRGHKIGVVVPAFNEERFIEATLREIPPWVDRIIVVDDASTDQTGPKALSRVHKDERVRLVTLPARRGAGAAILAGYASLQRDNQCQMAVVMAGDNQMDPADLPYLLDPICEKRAVYTKGTRFRHPDLHKVMPRTRYLGNRVLTWFTRVMSGYEMLEDAQCGYTALHTTQLRSVLDDGLVDGYGFPNAMLVFLGKKSAKMEQIPVRPIYRDEESGLNFFTVLKVYPPLFLRSWWSLKRKRTQKTSTPESKGDNALTGRA